MDHTILQYALPFVLDPSNLVVGAKDNVAHAWTFIRVLLTFRVRIVQIAVDSFVICAGGRALGRLR